MGSNLRYTKDSIIQRPDLGRTLFPILRKHGISFSHTGRCHAQRPLFNTTTNISLGPASGGLFSGAYKNPRPGTRWDQSVSSTLSPSSTPLSPSLNPTAPIGKTYSSTSIQDSITSASERAQSAADEPVFLATLPRFHGLSTIPTWIRIRRRGCYWGE